MALGMDLLGEYCLFSRSGFGVKGLLVHSDLDKISLLKRAKPVVYASHNAARDVVMLRLMGFGEGLRCDESQ